MNQFVKQHGWSMGAAIAGDASARRYFRITKNNKTAVLMDASADKSELDKFIRIAGWLEGAGLKAPKIYEADEKNGFLLLEDFGELNFSTMLEDSDPRELYTLAYEVLTHLQKQKPPSGIPEFSESNLNKAHRRIVDWYLPAIRKQKNPEHYLKSYLAAWDKVEKAAPSSKAGFVHGDFHPGNLMWVPGEKGIRRCGILDFQGAVTGPCAYDLVNLLEDARRDVSVRIKDDILKNKNYDFLDAYAVLSAKFHFRVIGQFIRLAIRDGKPAYLEHIPRLEAYIRHTLKQPVLWPLKEFFEETGIDFNVGKIDMAAVKKIIRPDAY